MKSAAPFSTKTAQAGYWDRIFFDSQVGQSGRELQSQVNSSPHSLQQQSGQLGSNI
jgi:hypothetical protein